MSEVPLTESDTPLTQSEVSLTESDTPLTQSEVPLTESDTPLTRSEVPLTESDTPLTQSEVPLTESDTPLTQSEVPLTESDTPLTQSEVPLTESDTPLTQSEVPLTESDTPLTQSEVPLTESDTPLTQSEVPLTESDTPLTQSEVPLTEPDTPLTQSEVPLTEPDIPLTQSEAPLTEPDTPLTQSEVPLTESDTPSTLKEQVKQVEEFLQKPKVVFGISLKSKKVSRDWALVQKNLSKTIRTILNNTDPNFSIIIAGHEKPKIKEMKDKRIKWLSVKFSPPKNARKFSNDKFRKRMVIGSYLRKLGFSGYFMPLDADDWIHYRFVEYIRFFPVTDAFILNKGFMVNVFKKEAWIRDHFYRGCGSSAVFYFSNDQFPKTAKMKDVKMTPFRWTLIHGKVQQHLEKGNKSFIKVDYPLVTWVLAHGENNSMIKKKKDNSVSAKSYKKYNAVEGKLEDWFYDYFRIDAKR